MREPFEPLTAREDEVLDLLRRGLTNAEIAGDLGITEYTTKEHVSNILRKLGVRSRDEASYWPERAPWWARVPIVAPIASLLRSAGTTPTALPVWIAGAVLIAVAVALTLLAVLVVRSDGDVAPNRTGISEIDRVLDAVESADPERIEPLIELTERPCEIVPPNQLLPEELVLVECEDGETEATPVDAYWLSTCVGSWWYRASDAEVGTVVGRIVEWDLSLFAVYRGREDLSETWVLHDQVALFATDQKGAERGIGLLLRDGKIVGTDEDCGLPPNEMAEPSHLTDPILIVDKEPAANTPTP